MWPLWRCLSTTRSTVGRQSSSKVFYPFKFSGWQITHLFQLQSIWRRPLHSCTAIFSLSNADWNELQCFEGPHKLIVRTWTNLAEWHQVFFPGKSHQCLTVVSLQEALEMVVLQRRIGGVEPEEADVVWGSPKLPPSIWGGGAGYNTNAYLNDHFAFICIHLKIK